MVKLIELFDAVVNRITYGPRRTDEEITLREQNKELWAENEELSSELESLREELNQKAVLLQLFNGVLVKQSAALNAIRDEAVDATSGVKANLHRDFRRKIACPVGEKLPAWADDLHFLHDNPLLKVPPNRGQIDVNADWEWPSPLWLPENVDAETAEQIAASKPPVQFAKNYGASPQLDHLCIVDDESTEQ